MNRWNWIHKLLNPHCPDCLADELTKTRMDKELYECSSCNMLQMELSRAHQHIDSLMSIIHPIREETKITDNNGERLKPIPMGRQFIPTRVKNEFIAQNDNRTLELLKQRRKEIDDNDKVVENTKDISTEELESTLLKTNVLESNG